MEYCRVICFIYVKYSNWVLFINKAYYIEMALFYDMFFRNIRFVFYYVGRSTMLYNIFNQIFQYGN